MTFGESVNISILYPFQKEWKSLFIFPCKYRLFCAYNEICGKSDVGDILHWNFVYENLF